MDSKKGRQLSHKVFELHNECGFSCVRVSDGEALIEKIPDELELVPQIEVPGKELTAKAVRKLLWENRKNNLEGGFLWSLFDEGDGKTYAGLAHIQEVTHG